MLPRFNAQPELVGLIDQNTRAEYEDRIEQVTQFEADTRWFSVTDNMAPHEQVPLTAWSGEESISGSTPYVGDATGSGSGSGGGGGASLLVRRPPPDAGDATLERRPGELGMLSV